MMNNSMLNCIFGSLIVLLFSIRPFVYKKPAVLLDSNASSIFTALWSILIILFLLPFFILNNSIVFVINYGILGTILKGICLYNIIKHSQIINKEDTSSSVAWGPLALAISAIFNYIFLRENLSHKQLFILISLFLVSSCYFFMFRYKVLSNKAKFSFFIVVLSAVINFISDRFALMHIHWYIHILVSYITMLIISIYFGINKDNIISCIKNKITWSAGLIYAIGEITVIMSMQKVFDNVSYCAFLIRIAQALAIILAYHIYKEGKICFQYLFAFLQLILLYFFFF